MEKYIVIMATLDTKGEEVNCLKERIIKHNDIPVVLDLSMGPVNLDNSQIIPDIKREEIAKAAGRQWEELTVSPSRDKTAPVLAEGSKKILLELITQSKAHGIVGLGGTQGTTLCSEIMRALPYGFPKIMVSTVASSDVSRFIDIKDIVMFPSVSDILGLNPVLRKILSNAAAAVCGMANDEVRMEIGDVPLIGMVNVGITTPGAFKAIELLKEAGYETIVFHGVGTGGRAMEQMIKDGIIGAVFDYALVEISNYLYRGLNDGGPERLTAAGKAGIPQVICPGGIEVLAWWIKEGDPLPDGFKGRKEIRHSALITTVRCNKEEMLNAAKEVVKRLMYTKNNAVFMIPKGAFSTYSKKGTVFYDPEADSAFSDYVKKNLPKNFEVVEVEADLTDERFVKESISRLLTLIKNYKN